MPLKCTECGQIVPPLSCHSCRPSGNTLRGFVLHELRRGDIVRHRGSGDSYVITEPCGPWATAVRTIRVSNPSEWLLVENAEMSGGR